MINEFVPYNDLVINGDNILWNMENWMTVKFYQALPDFDEIEKLINFNYSLMKTLFKKLAEENLETAETCNVLRDKIN